MKTEKITLLNGNLLECIIGTKTAETTQPVKYVEDLANIDVFKYFANFLLENADRIMSDSRMFFCPIYTQSFSPFFNKRPILGTFLEWWLEYPEFSRDKNGNPVYYISGNPMTGSHACYSISKDGSLRITMESRFSEMLKSFGKVLSLYKNVKDNCEFYQLDEVLKKLCGDKYELHLELIRTQSRLKNLTQYYKEQQGKYSIISQKLNRVMYENKKMQLANYKNEILKFYSEYKPLADEEERQFKEYTAQKQEIKKNYKFGIISENEYHEALSIADKKYESGTNLKLYELSDKFLKKTFGMNPNEITVDDIIRFAEGKPVRRNFNHF